MNHLFVCLIFFSSLSSTQVWTTSFFQRQDGQSRYGEGDTGKGNETFFSDLEVPPGWAKSLRE